MIPSLTVARRLLVGCLLLTVAMYWAGLHGPFLLDDENNLSMIRQWLSDEVSLGDMLFTRIAGPFGRPVAMASLALSAKLGGFTPFAFKAGNLLVHLACGVTTFALVRRVALRDVQLQRHADAIALTVTALFLLHPLNVSTVLYAVQRMAQLSTLALLLGLWFYMRTRERLQDRPEGRRQTGLFVCLFVGIPVIIGFGFYAKENAILLPALCLVLELGCFRAPRPGAIKVFFAAFLLVPILAALALFPWLQSRFLAGYVGRDFDLVQRLLTEGRVLVDYVGKILLPDPASMGVYTDYVAISTSLSSPPSTLACLLVLLAATAAAVAARRRIPALFVGWGIFLVGHALEAGILPLELYFEHRNYLPMIGLLYGVIGLAVAAGSRVATANFKMGRVGPATGVVLVLLFALGTHARARIWGDEGLLLESAVAAHPDSMRAQLAVVDAAVRSGNLPRASAALDALTRSQNRKARAQGYLNRVNLGCGIQHIAEPRDLVLAVREAPPRISKDEPESFDLLLSNTATPCAGIGDDALARAAAAFAERASQQPDAFLPKAQLRHTAASLYARQGDWTHALPLALLAWQSGMPAAASLVLINAQVAAGDLAGADRTYAEAAARVDPGNPQDTAGMRWLRAHIDAAKAKTRTKTNEP